MRIQFENAPYHLTSGGNRVRKVAMYIGREEHEVPALRAGVEPGALSPSTAASGFGQARVELKKEGASGRRLDSVRERTAAFFGA